MDFMKLTKIEKIDNKTPELMLNRGKALLRYAELYDNKSKETRYQSIQEIYTRKYKETLEEGTKIKNTSEKMLAELNKDKEKVDIEPKVPLPREISKSISDYDKKRFEIRKLQTELKNKEDELRINGKQIIESIAEWFYSNGDFTPIAININTQDKNVTNVVSEIQSVNVWMNRLQDNKTRLSKKVFIKNFAETYNQSIIVSYSNYKKVLWLKNINFSFRGNYSDD
jgi:septal ring factor EnvC (AmiA/AmiB activator)